MLNNIIFILLFFCSVAQGQIITEVPKQENFVRPFIVEKINGYEITALAKFELTAKVLGIESYRLDKGAEISPYDFALGWKEMSSEKFLSKINITQSNRFYFWKTFDAQTYSNKDKIITQSANMHLIPANAYVKKMLDKASKGKNFYLRGYLVKVSKDNIDWLSSMVRTDTGAGACELIWVIEAMPM